MAKKGLTKEGHKDGSTNFGCDYFYCNVWTYHHGYIERHIVSLGCGLLTLVLVFGVCMHSEVAAAETLSLRSFMVPNFWFQTEAAAESSSGINWATILFIAGMMLMVEGMERAGFFRWLCLTIAKADTL